MPTEEHQDALLFLYEALRAFFGRRGKIYVAPMRLRVAARRFREPDLLLLDAADPRRGNRYWRGADLVLEVVSSDDPNRDLITKRREYAEAGIPEYWIVNPMRRTITVLALDGNAYREHGTFRRGDTATSSLIPTLAIAVGDVFDVR